MTIKERLKLVMEHNNLNLKEFSSQCETPYNTLQNYLLGRRKIGIDTITKIHVQLNINTNWLLTGQGEMYERKGTEKVETLGGNRVVT
ncbi:MAG TPA: XRE family transcriptional regulator [Thiotrichaceae bacterium]|nr:XRE family transcriptional regulator [Thiotrichaceae bacterium]